MAPKDIKHLFTEKGEVISAIVTYGAGTFQEIDSMLNKISDRWTDLHILLGELIQEGDIFLTKSGTYKVRPELVSEYHYFEEHIDEWVEPPQEWEYPDNAQIPEEPEIKHLNIISSTEHWLKLEKPETSLEKDHFYLEGHHLDTFAKFAITQAFNTIIVVNPFMDRSTPTQLLIKAKRNGRTVVIVTRNTNSPYIKKIHEWLKDAGITMLYHDDIHAKIIIIDDSLAVVSSMNFIKNATAGISWEAGIISTSKGVVETIKASIADLNLKKINSH